MGRSGFPEIIVCHRPGRHKTKIMINETTQTAFAITPKTVETAAEPAKTILANTKKSLGFIPNMYGFLAGNPALLDGYAYAYNSFRTHSGFSPVEQEVILLSVSLENECEYCVSAHSFVADNMSKVPQEVTNAIRAGKDINEPKLNALYRFTRAVTANRGHLAESDIQDFFDAGYNESHIMGVIAGVGVKTFSNYTNHIAKTQIDAAFESRRWCKGNTGSGM